MPIKIVLPLYVMQGRKKISLSRNRWENLHYRQKVEVKHAIQNAVALVLPGTRLESPIRVEASLYPQAANCDLGNFCDVLLKIASDVLVKRGCIVDDCVKHVVSERRDFISVDRLNPRLEVIYYGSET